MAKTKLGVGGKSPVDVTMIANRWPNIIGRQKILWAGRVLAQLARAVVERALGAELTHHPG